MSSRFPPNTKIKDFGYPESHPLHFGASLRHSFQYTTDESYTSDENSTILCSSSLNKSRRRRRRKGERMEEEGQGEGEEDEDEEEVEDADEMNCKARAIFDFKPENDNEIELVEGQIIWISYRHGQGWLVAEDPATGENGLVPEEYVEFQFDIEGDMDEDVAKPFLPEIFNRCRGEDGGEDEDEGEWVDTDDTNDYEDNDVDDVVEEDMVDDDEVEMSKKSNQTDIERLDEQTKKMTI
ncbi:NBP2 [Candida oxycetoniae]|uniref:NBP2 n=1 Tax=Candida oxycetoniae TaxID=497107 RepID=A0AAI9T0D6_9ASCO|nr:NBP2 [Candida oxycetoniae]KAI3406531.2 NBP2 [Candida oxycetoniae]